MTKHGYNKRDREFLERVIEERERIYDSRFKALEKLIDERDRLYESRFKAQEIAVQAALSAQEKSVSAAFAASEKAIVKAEQAQKEYNERSNEFRGQLDDQAKTLMPRPEAMALFRSADDKLGTAITVFEAKLANIQALSKSELEAAKQAFDKANTQITEQIQSLFGTRSEMSGRDLSHRDALRQNNWWISLIVGIIFGLLGFIMALLRRP